MERLSRLLGAATRFLDSRNCDLDKGQFERLVVLLKQIGVTKYFYVPRTVLSCW
jgi:hypothetical protein